MTPSNTPWPRSRRHTPTRTSRTTRRSWQRSRAVGSSRRWTPDGPTLESRRRPRPGWTIPRRLTARMASMDDAPGTTLRIDDLILRPWRPADAPAVFAVCQDPEIARWVTIPQPFERSDADAFIESALTMGRDGTGAPFAIVDAVTDALLGAVTRFGPEGHQATFGLWLAAAA